MKSYTANVDRTARKHEHILRTHASDYRVSAADWVRSIITSDQTGRWFPFILNSIQYPDDIADRADFFRRLAVIRACETATRHLATRARSNPRRQHPDDAVRVIYVPAVKRGSVHLHGWCRVPNTDTTTASLVWKEQYYFSRSGDAPSSLVRFSTDLCARLATKNIWWNLDDDHTLGSVEYAQRELKREQREWGQLEFQPAYLFHARVA